MMRSERKKCVHCALLPGLLQAAPSSFLPFLIFFIAKKKELIFLSFAGREKAGCVE